LTHEGVEIRREPGVALFMDVPTDEGDLRRKRLVLGYERRQGFNASYAAGREQPARQNNDQHHTQGIVQ